METWLEVGTTAKAFCDEGHILWGESAAPPAFTVCQGSRAVTLEAEG